MEVPRPESDGQDRGAVFGARELEGGGAEREREREERERSERGEREREGGGEGETRGLTYEP